ncbi:hypothetical protein IPC1296_01150 [Pseudomonas aeruginosa]|uniref:hypothetical protein n=1 Tax=Pseudomonas aeruginosa TaxID=287 RepID=UPI000F520905|nr:hypothetical protein [Pseudomonas aeruginosa]RPM20923.1 hypothetical protein IPC1296_01150 [Pseudomonas aeruginosa]
MTESKICTRPSGGGSLRHPCPARPAVEKSGGDERAAFELFVRKHCGMPEHIAVNWDAKFTNDAWEGWKARAALAKPSPAQAEQAEAERPIVSFEKYMQVMYDRDENAKRLDAALARVAELEQSQGAEVFLTLTCEITQLKSKLAELEKQEPVAYVLFRDGEVYYEIDDNIVISNTPGDETDLYRWLPVFTAPVAQAQQLHDLDAQCRDDVARALGLRPSQERGFAWSYLLSSIKSCVKASEDAAQAQHSVPDELRAICMLVAETGIKYGRGRHRAVAADECRAVVNAVLDADLSVGRACEYAGCCDKAHPGTSLCIAHHSKKAQEKLLAAAPGKEGV